LIENRARQPTDPQVRKISDGACARGEYSEGRTVVGGECVGRRAAAGVRRLAPQGEREPHQETPSDPGGATDRELGLGVRQDRHGGHGHGSDDDGGRQDAGQL
jgi:hypothetical protein